MPKFHVLIPAAGTGSRMGSELSKQYLPLNGKPLIHYSLSLFSAASRISAVHVVIAPGDRLWAQYSATGMDAKVCVHALGGTTRAATVLNGLEAIAHQAADDDWILVHDAARPGLRMALLDRLLDSVQDDAVGGLLAIPLADTLKRANTGQRVVNTEPREGLWQAQTPQMFRYTLLKQALRQADGAKTDEAQAVEALGYSPKLVPGELGNFKITYPQDLQLAEAILLPDTEE